MQFDRYFLIQLIRTTFVVMVTLVGIVWLFQTIRVLELVVNRGAPLTDFILMSITAIPLWLTIALPVSAFIAVSWVFQRLISDRELLVIQASGRSALQLARAPVILGTGLTMIMLANSIFVLPFSFGIYKEIQFRLRSSIPTVMLQEEVFIDVVSGMTMLIGEKVEGDLAKDIFLHDERTEGKTITMTARLGKFVEKDGAPAIILQDGVRTELNQNGDAGAALMFETHTVTITSSDSQSSARLQVDMNEDSIQNLLDPAKSPSLRYVSERYAEGHYRIVSPFLAIVLVLVATTVILFGQIRRDIWFKRMGISLGLAIVIISSMVMARSATANLTMAAPLLYISLAAPFFITLGLLAWPSLKQSQNVPADDDRSRDLGVPA